MTLSTYDWKKAAAQVIDNNSVERAFMDQAYGFLANKAGKLMQDPYKLGFEVVYKNDGNTRMVGIFAFRINDQILYAPVFFLNGEIKGTDLLYRQESKTFVPLNEEWVSYLTEKNSYEPGVPIDKSQFTRTNNHVRFEDIAYPPNYKRDKSAAEDDIIKTLGDIDKVITAAFEKKIPAKATLVQADADAIAADSKLSDKRKSASENNKAGGLIRQFLEEDGGTDAIEKLASWMESSFDFTEALVTNIDEKDYMPSNIKVTKQASAVKDEPSLVLFTGTVGNFPHAELLKRASDDKDKDPSVNKFADKFFSQGYYLWDDRAPKDVVPVYRDNTEDMDLIGETGLYDVLLSDGTFRKAIVGRAAQNDINGCKPPYCGSSYGWSSTYNQGGVVEDIKYNSTSRPMYTNMVVCFLDGKKESGTESRVHGKFIKDQSTLIKDGDMDTKPKAGNAYRIFDAESGGITSAFYVKSIKDVDGVCHYEIVPEYGTSTPVILRHNTDHGDTVRTDIGNNFLGINAYFIPVGTERYNEEKPSTSNYRADTYYSFSYTRIISPSLGNPATLHDWVMEYVKKASVLHDNTTDTFSVRFGPMDQTPYMPRIDMAVKLASAGINASVVDTMLDETKAIGQTNWYYGGEEPDAAMEKVAFPTMQLRDAVFKTTSNRQFNTLQQNPQSFVLRTKTDSLQTPPQLVGDAYDPGMGVKVNETGSANKKPEMKGQPKQAMSKEQLMTMSPDQIAQFSSSNQMPNVFEHGLVGSLVQVYDSLSMIDKYLPDLEEGLDRIGRILFLFYWKPRDFEDAYGTDDMSNLENQLLSNFKSFGTLVLDLFKRSKKRKLGNVSLGN